jgi:hypothetical protein
LDRYALLAFFGSIRAGGLILALAVYGVLGMPAPGRFGWREMAVGGGIVLATGIIRPLMVGTGVMMADPRARLHDVIGTAAFSYLLWVPLLRAVFSGNNDEDIYRDVVPLLFLFLPVLLVPGGPLMHRVLTLGLAAVGVLFALRWWWPGLAFRQVGRLAMPEGDGYLLNSPAVLFAAVLLPLLALERLERRPGLLSLILAFLLCGAAAIAGAALAGAVHRAALIMALAVVVGFAAWQARRKPLLALLLLATLAVAAVGTGQLTGTIQQIVWKTETYGLNERSAEAAAVLDQVGASWSDLLFGQGWGTLMRSPAVGDMWVSYTHSFATYMLLKTGVIGCLVTLAYVLSMVPALFGLMRADAPMAIALLPPLGLGLFAHTSFKYLCFGLLLSILNHEKIVRTKRPASHA